MRKHLTDRSTALPTGGFTAIEISAVATIIAILALVLIPIMRTQVARSRVVAAQDDLRGIDTGETTAFGYTDHHFRLQDLTRGTPKVEPGMTQDQIDAEYAKAPSAYWNIPLADSQKGALVNTWSGPYLAIHKYETVQSLLDSGFHAAKFRSDASALNVGEGPILVLEGDDIGNQKYPIDPWGSPYIFFGAGRIGAYPSDSDVAIDLREESSFGTSVVYSLGPDGLPGDGQLDESINYYRETGLLGTGDDLMREF